MKDRLEAVLKRDVSRETWQALTRFVALLLDANDRQNLIASSTMDDIWERHIFDSAQLFPLGRGSWLDIGSGPGLPGIVLAVLSESRFTLCEPRGLRVEFLRHAVGELGLGNVNIVHGKVADVEGAFDTVTARAVAPATKLFAMAKNVSHAGTVFVLPKGRSAQSELDEAEKSWQGSFRLEPSVTSAEASILVASGVKPRGRK